MFILRQFLLRKSLFYAFILPFRIFYPTSIFKVASYVYKFIISWITSNTGQIHNMKILRLSTFKHIQCICTERLELFAAWQFCELPRWQNLKNALAFLVSQYIQLIQYYQNEIFSHHISEIRSLVKSCLSIHFKVEGKWRFFFPHSFLPIKLFRWKKSRWIKFHNWFGYHT